MRDRRRRDRLSVGAVVRQIAKSRADLVRHIRIMDPNILVFVVYGFLYDVVMNVFKPFALKYLDRIGGSEFHISLYNSLPGVAAIFAIIPGAIFINRFVRKKRVTTVFLGISRLFFPLLIITPFLDQGGAMVFVFLMAGTNFFDAIGQSSLQGMLGSLFSGHTRARAISLRNKFGNIAVLTITCLTGLLLSFIPKSNGQAILLYQIFFGFAFVVGIVEVITFNRFKETDDTVSAQKMTVKLIALPLKDKKFMRFMIPTITFCFTWQIGWPMGGILQVKTMSGNELDFAILAITAGLSAAICAGRWGKFIAKRGNDMMLVVGALGIAINGTLMAISPNMPVLYLVNAFGGGVTVGMNIAMLNGLLESTPDANRVVYIGVYNTLVNLSLATSPFVGYFLYNALNVRPTLLVISAARLIPVTMLFLRMRKNRAVHSATT